MKSKNEMENFQKLNIFQVSLIAAILASVSNTVLFFVSKIFDISLLVPSFFETGLASLQLGKILLATTLPAFLAGFIFWTMKKIFKKNAIKDFLVVCSGFLLFSLGSPILLSITLTAKIFLVTMHIFTAFFIGITFYNYDTSTKK